MPIKRDRVSVYALFDETPNPMKSGHVCTAGEMVRVQPNKVDHMCQFGFTTAAPKRADKPKVSRKPKEG